MLNRLDIIETSEEIGLSLADISSHLHLLEADSCTDVRDHLRSLVAARVCQLDKKRAHLDAQRARFKQAEDGLANCQDRDEYRSTACVFRARTTTAPPLPEQSVPEAR